MLVVSPAILLQRIAWTQRVTKRLLCKTEADSFVRWSIFSLSDHSDEHFHYHDLIDIFIIFDLTSKQFSSSLFVSQFGVSYFVNRTEEIFIYAPVHTEQEEITMKSAKFTKCTNGQKKILALTRFGSNWEGNHELCGARRRFALDFLTVTTHWTK